MSLPSRERVRRLLAETSRPSTREREALVDSVARDSPEIGRELRRLLAALDETSSLFAPVVAPTPPSESTDLPAAPAPGSSATRG